MRISDWSSDVCSSDLPNPGVHFIKALLTSTAVVALAEVGDKTQLLAIVLATRFKRPWPIIGGIFAATIANHFLAALLGAEVSSFLDGRWFRYVVAVSFIAMAVWTLIHENLAHIADTPPRFVAFLTPNLDWKSGVRGRRGTVCVD